MTISSFWVSIIIFALFTLIFVIYCRKEILKFDGKTLVYIVIIIVGVGMFISGVAWAVRPFSENYFEPSIYDTMVFNFLTAAVLMYGAIYSIKSLKETPKQLSQNPTNNIPPSTTSSQQSTQQHQKDNIKPH